MSPHVSITYFFLRIHQPRVAWYCLLKGSDIKRFYCGTVHFWYQYRILYFSNFYDVNKKMKMF
jgi:hypothetical protein